MTVSTQCELCFFPLIVNLNFQLYPKIIFMLRFRACRIYPVVWFCSALSGELWAKLLFSQMRRSCPSLEPIVIRGWSIILYYWDIKYSMTGSKIQDFVLRYSRITKFYYFNRMASRLLMNLSLQPSSVKYMAKICIQFRADNHSVIPACSP